MPEQRALAASHDANGRFLPGHPGSRGRLPARLKQVRDLILSQTNDGQNMVDLLAGLVRDPAIKGRPENVTPLHLKAAELLLAYGFGKPKESVDLDVTAHLREMTDEELNAHLREEIAECPEILTLFLPERAS